MMSDENELVERLYRLHFKKLFIYANAVLRDPEQAKDVVQDTFHEALRRIDVFATHENPGGWLMNTLKNKLKENERTRRAKSVIWENPSHFMTKRADHGFF